MSSIINCCNAQNIINDIETYIFEPLFNAENKITELIEFNESKDTTRYWRFNTNFQLIEEIDNRPSFWPYAAGWHMSARPSKKKFEYKYDSNGQLDTIDEIHSSEGDTIKTTHLYTYPDNNTITQFYKRDLNELINYDFEFTQIMSKSKKQETKQISKSYIGEGYVQTEQRLQYSYGKDEELKEVNHYFKVNSYPPNKEEEPVQENLGSKERYHYDSIKRLQRIKGIEYTEDGSQKPNREVTFTYSRDSNKIEQINLKYGENHKPREMEYKVAYEQNGDIKTISYNGKIYHYQFKR